VFAPCAKLLASAFSGGLSISTPIAFVSARQRGARRVHSADSLILGHVHQVMRWVWPAISVSVYTRALQCGLLLRVHPRTITTDLDDRTAVVTGDSSAFIRASRHAPDATA
jgi:hypothetical protein